MTPRRWTAEEDALLRQWSREGVPVQAMAERLGRTFRGTAQRRERIGCTSPKQRHWSSVEIARARRMYDGGVSPTRIAEALHRTPASVRKQLGRHGGLDYARKGIARRRDDTRVYDLRRRGLIFREILLVLRGPEWDTDHHVRTLATWFRRYLERVRLPTPEVPQRRRVDPARVEAERQRLGLTVRSAAG